MGNLSEEAASNHKKMAGLALASAVTATAYLAPRATSSIVSTLLQSTSSLVISLAESTLVHPEVHAVIAELDIHSMLRVLTAVLNQQLLLMPPAEGLPQHVALREVQAAVDDCGADLENLA